jgi:stress response protein YsnF
MTKIVIAFYDQAEHAQQISQELSRLDIAQNEMSVLGGQSGSGAQGLLQGSGSGQDLIEQLGRFGVSQEEAELYAKGLEHGGGLVIARVEDEKAEQAGSAMERQPVVDIDARAQQWRSEGRKQQPQQGEHQEGQTVRAVEEQLQVGKRETQAGRVRIHTHLEETPVEERVRLREEEISVDRKRADRTLSPDEVEGAFREQTSDVSYRLSSRRHSQARVWLYRRPQVLQQLQRATLPIRLHPAAAAELDGDRPRQTLAKLAQVVDAGANHGGN